MGLIHLTFWDKVKLCYRILKAERTSSLAHAETELTYLALKATESPDETQVAISKDILEMVTVFSTQGQSGFSASYATGLLTKLLDHKTLAPLTGEDDEWMDCSDYTRGWIMFQNRRNSGVFKDETGAYYMYGKVFVEPSGASYSSGKSRTYLTFPCTPTTTYIQVDKDGNPIEVDTASHS